ncbi:MAG TPA: DUF4178 domain-containing protein [Thermodesulfobacteriota bacterium]|nr:DUF4178 domain-containing protein [Thermodesulfobacteriota bacterium]
MDGKDDPSPLTQPAAASAPPRVKTLKCPGCGNSLTVRGLERTESIACDACGSILDLTDENLRIISTFQSRMKFSPLIPLGARGKIKGELYEVIGFLRRVMTVEGVDYGWSEYLLFNPYLGFRWLSEYNGHWNYLKTTTRAPETQKSAGRPKVRYLDKTFVHFQTYAARVVFVLGEFYWRVEAGESCTVSDYISPPLILSLEKTEREGVWSLGEYMEPEALRQAFQVAAPFPRRVGVAPNQPSPYKSRSSALFTVFGYLCLAAVLVHFGLMLLAQNKLVYQKQFLFEQSAREKSLVTDAFEISGHTSNVVIRSAANVNNSWIYLHMALISDEGRAYDFGREISYYHGVDGGESWSEGGRADEAILPSIPAGKYYLRIEPESPVPALNYTIQVYRDVPRWSFFLIALGALCVIPIVGLWRSARFESARWAEGD